MMLGFVGKIAHSDRHFHSRFFDGFCNEKNETSLVRLNLLIYNK